MNRRILLPFALIILVFSSCNRHTTKNLVSELDFFKDGYNNLVVKNYKAAIQSFTKVIEMNPEDPEAYAYRGLCKYYIEDYEGAIEDYTKALEIQPNYAEAYDLRGIAKGELGDKGGACEDWKMAFQFGFNDAYDLIKEFCMEEEEE